MVTIGSTSYSYDSNGNLTSKTDGSGTWSYSWDYENRLKQVTRPDSTTVSYKYDALGRRIQRSKSAGGSTNYIYDGQDVIRDINSDNNTVDYLNSLGVDDKLRQTSLTSTLYFSKDHLGSTRALTDSSGNVVESVNYDSFGNGSSSLTRYGYTGREWDPDANLYYYRNRWYDPQAGRFISEDPIGLNGGVNLYAYVINNPTRLVDPKGTDYLSTVMTAIEALDAIHAAQKATPVDCMCDGLPPSGDPVEVVIWDRLTNPLSLLAHPGSALGHVSYVIDGYMYSWEAHGWAPLQKASDYIDDNRRWRSGTGYVLDFGSREANARFASSIQHAYDSFRPDHAFPYGYPYNGFNNNCGHALPRALDGMGYHDTGWLPSDHQHFIEKNLQPRIIGKNNYSQTGSGAPAVDDALYNLGSDVSNLYGAHY